MKPSTWPVTAVAFTISLCLSTPLLADGVSIDDVVNDAKTTNDVVTAGLGDQGQRYSPLKSINKDNVGDLVAAWAFSLGGEKKRGQETQPLVKDGVMYVTGSYSRMWAIDTKTGHKIWEYNHRLPEGIMPCCDVVNRGAALFGNDVSSSARSTPSSSRSTRRPARSFGPRRSRTSRAATPTTAAPLIVPSKAHGPILVTGVSGGEFGIVGRVEARKVCRR